MSRTHVAVVGYGVIGRRIADAVRLQEDMLVVGIAARPTSWSLRDAHLKGYDLYLTDPPKSGDFCHRVPNVRGQLCDLLEQSDVVLDCTPSGIPSQYVHLYDRFDRLVTIVQGGEKHKFAGTSFNSFCNYQEALGKRRIRVISCSSTGTTRFVYAMHRAFGVRQVFVALVRRAADPAKAGKTPTNALTPVLGMSHHAGDVNCVLPDVNIISMSVDSATTFSHAATFQADLCRPATREQVFEALDGLPRITVGNGLRTTADVAEYYQDLGRTRRDWPEIYVWAEGIRVEGATVYATISVHMESITIPETVDCIRAAIGIERDPWVSILKTDRALGIAKSPQCYRG